MKRLLLGFATTTLLCLTFLSGVFGQPSASESSGGIKTVTDAFDAGGTGKGGKIGLRQWNTQVMEEFQKTGMAEIIEALETCDIKKILPYLSENAGEKLKTQVEDLIQTGEIQQFRGAAGQGFIDMFLQGRASVRFQNLPLAFTVEAFTDGKFRIFDIYKAGEPPRFDTGN